MLPARRSLLAGRNTAPLSADQQVRVSNTFLGMEERVNTYYDEQALTAFRVVVPDYGEQYGEIVFGPDIYPGTGVLDPNSALSIDAAAAHELTHYHRWRNMTALQEPALEHVDEAQTSLEAILRYDDHLTGNDVRQLVRDALQRLQLYVAVVRGGPDQGVP